MGSQETVRNDMVREAARLFGQGYRCSEVVFLLTMKAWSREVDPDLVRIASGFGGGIGDGGDLCGCVTGGVMALGLLHGRTDPGEGDPPAYRLSKAFRDRFLEANGSLNCRDLTGGAFTPAALRGCTRVVMNSLALLLDLLETGPPVPGRWARDRIRPIGGPVPPGVCGDC